MFSQAILAAAATWGGLLAAIADESVGDMLLRHILGVVIFAALGLAVFAAGIWVFVRLSPFSVRKEIEEDHNTALAIIMGSVLIGVSIIIAAAILG